jgi:hypothetical protein
MAAFASSIPITQSLVGKSEGELASKRKPVFVISAFAVLLVSLIVAPSASATFHLMKVREVSSGTGTDNSYVEIQMYSPLQNFLSNGAKLAWCTNSTCSIVPGTFSPSSDVANGNSQDTVLFGDSGIAAGNKDFNVDLNLQSAGGAVCYVSEPGYSDCVSWGDFSANSTLTADYGASADPGTPAPALSSGMALRRSISPTCPTFLEASDDTNNSAIDFALTPLNPRPNSVAPTETACSSSAPTGYPAPPVYPSKKRRCKKHKRSSTGAYAAKKKCKRRK